MLTKNEVILRDGRLLRILFTDEKHTALFSLDKEDQGRVSFTEVDTQALLQEVKQGITTTAVDPYAELISATPRSKAQARAEANYNLLLPVISQPHILYTPALCTAKLKEISRGDPSLLRKLYRLLSCYFQRGQCFNALLPDYRKTGKTKRSYTKIPGRKNADGEKSVLCDDSLRDLMDQIIKNKILTEGGLSLEKAYAHLLNAYKEKNPEAAALPSLGQLRYHYYSRYNRRQRNQGRYGKIRADKDILNRSGSVYSTCSAIGEVYEIDSTVDNVYLVSDADRTIGIGRPVIYLVTDRYSGLITGCYVGLESAKFATAAEALYCAISNKKTYFKDNFNIATQWQAQGVPACVCADNAELEGEKIELFARNYQVNLCNTAPYSPHQKGSVESALGQLQRELKYFLHSYLCDPDPRQLKKAGAKDNRLNGILTLNEYRSLVVRAIEVMNSRCKGKTPPHYPVTSLKSPDAIWEWAAATGRSDLLNIKDNLRLKVNLLPVYEATASREGIKCQKIHYHCAALEEAGCFDRDSFGHTLEKPVMAVDPGNVANAWIYPYPQKDAQVYYRCTLADEHGLLHGCTIYEARQVLCADSRRTYQTEQLHQQKRAEQYKYIGDIIREAATKTKESQTSLSDKERLTQAPLSRIKQREQDLKDHRLRDERDSTQAPKSEHSTDNDKTAPLEETSDGWSRYTDSVLDLY